MTAIAITLGDPAGVGPEVTTKALQQLPNHDGIILFGHKEQLSDIPLFEGTIEPNTVYSHPIQTPLTPTDKKDDPDNARIAYESITSALHFCNTHSMNLVTAPISKAGFLAASIPYTGHTTLLKDFFNSPNASMAFYSDQLSVILATIHIPLMSVETALTSDTIKSTLANAKLFANQLGITNPKIGIAGLNPHASEHGQFGDFESNVLTPTLTEFKEDNNTAIIGPVSPDVIFRQALDGDIDVVVALYHDQGLIPLKLLAFDSAVNVTVGLPICRTSPDHGTAYDIAGKNIANPNSMLAAIKYCINR